jgi:hypothetical protein
MGPSLINAFVVSSSKGYPRYCEAQSLADGTTILTGGRSRRGKLRGPPGSRDLQVRLFVSCRLYVITHYFLSSYYKVDSFFSNETLDQDGDFYFCFVFCS